MNRVYVIIIIIINSIRLLVLKLFLINVIYQLIESELRFCFKQINYRLFGIVLDVQRCLLDVLSIMFDK